MLLSCISLFLDVAKKKKKLVVYHVIVIVYNDVSLDCINNEKS